MRIAVLDDWQGVALRSADWSGLRQNAELVVFERAFPDADAAAEALTSKLPISLLVRGVPGRTEDDVERSVSKFGMTNSADGRL